MATVTSQLPKIDFATEWKQDPDTFPVHHDPSNVFAAHFGIVTDDKMPAQRPGYAKGGAMVQPACIVVDSSGYEIYSWRLQPSPENLGGAIDRPFPAEVWAYVQAKLDGVPESQLPAVSIDRQEATAAKLAKQMPPMVKLLEKLGRLPAGSSAKM